MGIEGQFHNERINNTSKKDIQDWFVPGQFIIVEKPYNRFPPDYVSALSLNV